MAWPLAGSSAKPLEVEKENTRIVDGAGEKSGITGRCEQIQAQVEETTSDCGREELQERLAMLGGGVATIRVGGSAEVGVKERIRPDRINSTICRRNSGG
jgi:chaperonin GroEL